MTKPPAKAFGKMLCTLLKHIMKKNFALALIPASAMAEDFSGQKSIGLIVILALGACAWIVGAKLLRMIFRKDRTEVGDGSKVRK